jgi:hypothetical protein
MLATTMAPWEVDETIYIQQLITYQQHVPNFNADEETISPKSWKSSNDNVDNATLPT